MIKTINLEDITKQCDERIAYMISRKRITEDTTLRTILRDYFIAGFIAGRKNAIESLP